MMLSCYRRRVKSRARADVGESLEDARIWATDMSPGGGGGHYEKINMQSVAGSQQYESIKNMQTQVNRIVNKHGQGFCELVTTIIPIMPNT